MGREERKTAAWLGSESGTSIKVSILCERKDDWSATTPKVRAETANNKEADPRSAAGGTGAERRHLHRQGEVSHSDIP